MIEDSKLVCQSVSGVIRTASDLSVAIIPSGLCWRWQKSVTVTHARRPSGHSTRGMSDLHGCDAAKDDAL